MSAAVLEGSILAYFAYTAGPFCPFVPLVYVQIYAFSVWTSYFGGKMSIWPVKNFLWWGAGMVICLVQGANDLHMVHHLLLS